MLMRCARLRTRASSGSRAPKPTVQGRASMRCRCQQPSVSSAAPASGTQTRTERRVWKVLKKGSVNNLSMQTEQLEPPGPGEVQIAVRCIGLNFADVFSCLGLYSATPRGEFIPGLEFSGIVTAVGAPSPGAARSDLRPGDRVLGVTRFGAYATAINLKLDYVRRVPEGWTLEEAAAYPVQTLTAWYGLKELGALRRGMTVLVHSAAGGVGLQALQILARFAPVHILGTVSSQEKANLLAQRFTASQQHRHTAPTSSTGLLGGESTGGASTSGAGAGVGGAGGGGGGGGVPRVDGSGGCVQFVVRPRSGKAFEEQLRHFLAQSQTKGFDIVFDSLQGPYLQPAFDALSPAGRLIVFGAAALTPSPQTDLSLTWRSLAPASLMGIARMVAAWIQRPRIDALKLPGQNKSIMGFNLIWLYEDINLFSRLYDEMDALHLPPPLVGTTMDFAQLPDALKRFQSGDTVGKVVVTVQP